MAHSRKFKSNKIITLTKSAVCAFIKPHDHVVVALSGGIDSVVLLDLLKSLSAPLQFSLSAIHVDHGISQNARNWCKFCSKLCRALEVPITIAHVKVTKQPGISLEAAAREARYQVFCHLQADYIALGQHQNDQAETIFLQLLRGAGVAGLASMPIVRKQPLENAPQILRPMLDVSRQNIQQYALEKNLTWIEDESNENIAFDRNYLRHKIIPLLKERYPACQATLSRSSRHMAEACHLLNDLAVLDYQQCMCDGKLQTAGLRNLTLPRAKNLLRYILAQQGIRQPSSKKLADILQQLLTAGTDTKLQIPVDNVEFRCYQGIVVILPRKTLFPKHLNITWRGEERVEIKELNGSIHFLRKKSCGISIRQLNQKSVTIQLRAGGERFRPDCKRPRRKLKNLYQEALIPPWERQRLPLIFCDDRLVWVPYIGVECEFQARQDEEGLLPSWQPNKNFQQI